MAKWWLKTVAAGWVGAILGLAIGAAIVFSDPYRFSSLVNDVFYAGSPALGAGVSAGLAGTHRLPPTLIAIFASALVTGALIAAIRADLIDLTGIEPVVVLVVAGLSAAVGAFSRTVIHPEADRNPASG